MKSILNRIIAYPGLIIFFSAVLVLSVFFHQPLEIIDALSADPVPGLGIHISAWRILFEPITGPLLFYLRADQPALEFAVLLFWILVLSLIITLMHPILPGNNTTGRFNLRGLLTWLKTAPLIIITWLGLLWLIIYLPLPSNTIVNHEENTILINTHCHTEYSHDGIISTLSLQKWHHRNGFDAFFITDHNHHQKTLEAVKAQEDGALAKRSSTKLLFPPEPLMMRGEEYSGSNHMTLLGISGDFITRGLTDQQVIDSTHKDNGVVIVAHWFDDERKTIPFFTDMGVDGFEIANQGSGLSYERRIFESITEACAGHGLVMVGAADYHGYGSSCFVWNALEIPGWKLMDTERKREAIMELLRQRDMSRIRVLLYHDRNVFDRSRVMLSPLYNAVNYFRTLNALQLFSWFLWLVLLTVLRTMLKHKIKKGKPLLSMQVLALVSSIFLLTNGIILNLKAPGLTGFNEIYTEYGTIMLLCGAGFLIYTFILMYLTLKKKPSL